MRRGIQGDGGQGLGGSLTINFVIDTSWKVLVICVNIDDQKTFRFKVFLGQAGQKLF